MCYISPSYELRFLCSHPEFVGITVHKAFRTIYKWPQFIDFDLYCHNVLVTKGWQDKVKLPSIWDGYTDTTNYQNSLNHPVSAQHVAVMATQLHPDDMFFRLQPFIPRYSFQDSYHMLKQLVITSDLPSSGEISMNG